MTPGIHQVLAGAAERDAITNHALAAQRVIRDMGFASEVFVEDAHISPEVGTRVHEHTKWDAVAQTGDLAIVHYSIDSPAFDYALDRAAKSAVHYHNVTPAELLWRDLPALAAQCRDGRTRLGEMTGRVVRSASDSQFNAQEMLALDLPPADVVGMALAALGDAGVDAELRLVGSWGGSRPYFERCLRTARMLGVTDSVVVLDSLSDEDLAREYADADVFLCLSDHEGYCVPLLEAMAADLPIVAFAAGAVPETLGRAGLLLNDKSPSVVAEAVAAVLGGALAGEMRDGRGAQLAHHSREATAQRLQAFIGEFATC